MREIATMFKFRVGGYVTTKMPYSAVFAPALRAAGDVKMQTLKNIRIPCMVVERMYQECPGGVQIHYKVRPHSIEVKAAPNGFLPESTEPYWQVWAGAPIVSFNEIELEAYPPETPTEEREEA